MLCVVFRLQGLASLVFATHHRPLRHRQHGLAVRRLRICMYVASDHTVCTHCCFEYGAFGPTSPKTTSPVAFRIWCCDLSAEWWLIGEGTMRERVSPYPLPILQETSSCLYGFDGVAFESKCLFHVVVSCLCRSTTHLSPRTLHSHTCLQETVVNGKQKGKCTKGAACSFHHDETKRGKSTRSFSLSCVPFGIPRLSSAASSSSAAPPSTLSSSQDSSRTGIYAKTGEKKN